MARICDLWSTENVLWKNSNWTWSECQIIAEILAGNPPGVDATTLIQPWMQEEPWNPYKAGEIEKNKDKRKKLIKLICKVKGEKYEEERYKKDFKITTEDIKLVVKTMTGIDLDVKVNNVL